MGTMGQSVTLANSIIGVGILAMPFCFQQCGVILATLILLFMGLVSRLCCYFLLKSALLARRRNYEFLAFHVFGPAGKLAVEVGIIGFLMGTCIAYFVVVGDLGPQIIAKLFNINQSDILRTSIMVIVSLVCVLPLGLLRNVDSLSNVSAATIGFYFCLVIKVISEAASCMWSQEWQSKVQLWRPDGLLQCVPIFSMALFCQTQLFQIFESLPTLSLEKMNVVTKNAINICTAVYFTLGLFGYIAFHTHGISGNILMSLSPTMASDVIKLGFVMSVAFSFPLIIFPCRASLYSFLYKKTHAAHHDHIVTHSIPESSFRCITVAIVAVALFVSLLIPNIELVLGLLGSTIGVLVCVVFPAACFVNLTFKNTNERLLAKGVLILGLIILVLGTYANLQAVESKLDRYDDKITPERIDKIVEDFFERREHKNADKPVSKNDLKMGSHERLKKEDKSDSEIQPPNPVPPDSVDQQPSKVLQKKEEKITEAKLVAVKDDVEKASETHPKNLQNKLHGEKNINEERQLNPNEKFKEETKPEKDKIQEKIDIMKHEQLIETIKQHGKEQKELIKEQKEILDELVKAKKELEQSKKDTNTIDAKKIAVESIQKIANEAIKSLSGVTDPPKGQNKPENLEVLEKIADEAKKAIEAISVTKDKKSEKAENNNKQNVINQGVNRGMPKGEPKNDVNKHPLQNNMPLPNAIQINNIPNDKPQVNNFVPGYPPVQQVLNENPIPPSNLPHAVSSPQNLIQPQVIPNVVPPAQIGLKSEPVDRNPNKPPVNKVAQIVQPNQQSIQDQSVQNPPDKEQIQNQAKQEQNDVPRINIPQQVQNSDLSHNQLISNAAPKPHAHLPDEPQSYKVGEDLQTAEMAKNVAENIPIPIALNGNNKAQPVNDVRETEKVKNNNAQNVENIIGNEENGARNNLNDLRDKEGLLRLKREVVDCTKLSSLAPEDREVCNALLDNNFENNNKVETSLRMQTVDKTLVINNKNALETEEILPSNVDLNKGLNRVPLELIHHSRSLKSYEDEKR